MNRTERGGIFLIGFGCGAMTFFLLVNGFVFDSSIEKEKEERIVPTGIELEKWRLNVLLDEQYKADGADCFEAETWLWVHSEVYYDTRPEKVQDREYRAVASELWADRVEAIC